jgi:hypothetical protein
MFTGGRRPRPSMTPGLWVLAGILLFTMLEMILSDASRNEIEDEEHEEVPNDEDQHVGVGVSDTSDNTDIAAHISPARVEQLHQDLVVNNGISLHANGITNHLCNHHKSYSSLKSSSFPCNGFKPESSVDLLGLHPGHQNNKSNGHTPVVYKNRNMTTQARRSSSTIALPPVKQVILITIILWFFIIYSLFYELNIIKLMVQPLC